jgi:hypothetical protein
VLEAGFPLDSRRYTYIFDHTNAQFQLAPDLPERNYCVSRGMAVLPENEDVRDRFRSR